jgi:hypothetical protein
MYCVAEKNSISLLSLVSTEKISQWHVLAKCNSIACEMKNSNESPCKGSQICSKS